MRTCEEGIAERSEYFIYAPSRMAQEAFLYPTQCGDFCYLPGYALIRNAFDSFLLMYIRQGELLLTLEGQSRRVTAGSFVLIDCYRRHGYATDKGWEAVWCHFDGVSARGYYQAVVSRLGNVFSLPDPYPALRRLEAVFRLFAGGGPVREPLLAKYLTDILTEFLLCAPGGTEARREQSVAEEAIAYIGEHFREELTVAKLAASVSLSPYHFIRVFKRETGFTPHAYLCNTRMATAKYLLKTTRLSVKDICFACGFSSESVFCGAFKRRQGLTPAQYRTQEGAGRQ